MKRLMLFFLGFFTGVIVTFFCKEELFGDSWILGPEVIYQIQNFDKRGARLFFFVLKERGSFLAIVTLLSVTAMGAIAIYAVIAWLGFAFGLFISSAVIRYGFKGVLIVIGSLFPQYFLYVPAFFLLIKWWNLMYNFTKNSGRSNMVCYGNKKQQLARIFAQFVVAAGVVIIGVLFESYVNPIIIKNIIKFL